MEYKIIKGGVVSPKGFKASGVSSGIKSGNKKDLALIYSENICTATGVFTKNAVKASPVILSQKHIKNGKAQAIIANSGNANACNAKGEENAKKMCKLAGNALNIKSKDVIVASTGVIGKVLPIKLIEENIINLKEELSTSGFSNAAEAIMTTDTVKKETAIEFNIDNAKVTIGVIAKGSGMININMGTMLSFVTTDVDISHKMLKSAFLEAVEDTYNMICVDGDTSTNDTLVILANGQGNNFKIAEKDYKYNKFLKALKILFKEVSKEIAADGEGATKLIVCSVNNGSRKKDCKKIAKTVICSSLVKTAMFGADANWGRILCAIGYSGVKINPEKISVSFKSESGIIDVCKNGAGINFDEDLAKKILLEKEVEIIINLNQGNYNSQAYGCDLTYDYVKINGDYRT